MIIQNQALASELASRPPPSEWKAALNRIKELEAQVAVISSLDTADFSSARIPGNKLPTSDEPLSKVTYADLIIEVPYFAFSGGRMC